MLREIFMANYMQSMSNGVGLTCDMGKDGRSEVKIGNGWVEHERPDGKKFYTNNDTGKRTWARPTEEGVLEEGGFEKCSGFVTKLKYEGRYPKSVEASTTAPVSDGYDCDSFLERLYEINEKKFVKEGTLAAGGASAPQPAAAAPAASDSTAA